MLGIGEGADAEEAFVGAQRQDGLIEVRIGQRRRGILAAAEENRRTEHAVSFVDADVEIGRADEALDGAELQTLDLAGDRPELALWIDLRL